MDIAPDILDGTSVSSGRLSAQVYGHVKSRILAHSFEPGAVLQELTLASEFGVSRTPVREALKLLTDEGLVIRRGRFYQTRQFSAVDVRQIYEVREALETASVCLCAARAGDSALADLMTMVAGQKEALQSADVARFSRLDSAFHLQHRQRWPTTRPAAPACRPARQGQAGPPEAQRFRAARGR